MLDGLWTALILVLLLGVVVGAILISWLPSDEPLPIDATITCPFGRIVSLVRDIPAGTYTLTCLDEGKTSALGGE